MLPHKDLEVYYGKVTWLFVSRNFKGDEKDREALRTHDRFGISSWPQLVLFDPREDKVLEQMSRQLATFKRQLQKHVGSVPAPTNKVRHKVARLERAKKLRKSGDAADALRLLERLAKQEDPVDAWLEAREILRLRATIAPTLAQRLADPDVRERAIAIEEITKLDGGPKRQRFEERIEQRLFDKGEHLIVKLRALAFLTPTRGAEIAKQAGALLRVPNDPFRYAALAVLRKHPNPALAEQLAELYAGVGKTIASGNPNVLRSHVARALESCGNASAIEPIENFVRTVQPNNGTLGATLAALRGIAARGTPLLRKKIRGIVVDSFPGPLEDPRYARFEHDWLGRRLPQIAKQVHGVLKSITGTEQLPKPPENWSSGERDRYLRDLRKRLD